MQYSVNLIPTPYFYPIGVTPANCLTEQLPPGERANCLLLGSGDPRDILFTIFNEEDNGIFLFDFTDSNRVFAYL